LGISRRKAGTIVRCTTCEGQLIVPDPDDPVGTEPAGTQNHVIPPGPPPTEQAGEGGGVFEHSDFDAFLEPLGAAQQPAAVASPPAAPAKGKRATAPLPAPAGLSAAAGSAPALVLTRPMLTLASVLLVLSLGRQRTRRMRWLSVSPM
jgi:hypothetical protein